MYKHKWAAIIYGRSYHVDFRFITLPQDFSNQEKDWASRYILATFSHANKLSAHPRWSLFKNDSHCVVGVTCMVRDLLVNLEQDLIDLLSKDNRGRPLYIFVGYVTQLDRRKRLLDFPFFSDRYLDSFQNLYQYLQQVWWIEEYHKDSKKPLLSNYQPIDFANQKFQIGDTLELAKQINHQEKYPNQTYLWHNSLEQKQKLWLTSAVSHQEISVCLGDQTIRNIVNTPFLNQTAICESAEIIEGCAIKKIERAESHLSAEVTSNSDNLSQVITNKVKEDIALTLHHAHLVKNKSRNLIKNVSSRSLNNTLSKPSQEINTLTEKDSNFGFKTKVKEPKNSEQEWF